LLLEPSLDEIVQYAINHLKSFPIQVYHQYKPQTVKPPLIVYRLSKSEKTKFQRYYKTLPDKNLHKIADANLTIHLFLIAPQNTALSLAQNLDKHIYSIKNTYINSLYIRFKYETFKPFDSNEFEKEGYLTMQAKLKANYPVLEEKITKKVQVVKNVKQI